MVYWQNVFWIPPILDFCYKVYVEVKGNLGVYTDYLDSLKFLYEISWQFGTKSMSLLFFAQLTRIIVAILHI